MRFSRISLENFRAYYGFHTLDFGSVADDGLIVIFGDNMSGKTAVFLAINWCLYGEALGRRGEQIPIYRPGDRENNYLINAKAIDVGDYRVHVRLEWEHDGDLWVLDRESKCEEDPPTDSAFVTRASLQIGDSVKYTQEIPRRINQVIHYKAAQFYFFDGELLSQYEKWLENPSEREVRVKRAVELTVGTAALRLHEEMERVAEDAENEQAKLVRKENRETVLLGELEERANRQNELVREIEEFRDHVDGLRNEADSIEQVHGALADYAENLGRIEELERSITRQQTKQQNAEVKIRELVRECYWMPLTGAVGKIRERLTRSMLDVASLTDGLVMARILEATLNSGECQVCGQVLDEHCLARVGDELQRVGSTSSPEIDMTSMEELFWRLAQTSRYEATGKIDQLKLLEEQRLDARAEAHASADEAEDIRAENPDRPRGDHESEMARLKDIFDQISDTQTLMLQAGEELEEVTAEVGRLRGKISRIEIDPSVLKKARAARLAADSTRAALEEFREVARTKVEQHASAIFADLVEEPGYGRISIDGDYRVMPIDDNGAILPIPSAGGQQLLTLALVGGLNAAAVHDAPVVMDTPAGRIDRANRTRILQWLNGLRQQVILMVHSGEFTPDEIIRSDVAVARAYQIEKTGTATSEFAEFGME